MIKLFSLKQQKKEGEGGGQQKSTRSAAQLRITKGKIEKLEICLMKKITFIFKCPDINELNLPRTCTTSFPDPNDLLNFKMIICPDEGYYRSGRFVFNFKVSQMSLMKDPALIFYMHTLTGRSKLSARTTKSQMRDKSVSSKYRSGR
jgi:hypothetical protein